MPRAVDSSSPRLVERLLIPDIRELLEQGDPGTIAELLNRWVAADVASLLMELDADEQAQVLRLLEPQLRTETFEHLDLTEQEDVLSRLSDQETAEILNRMAPDDRTALLEELPAEQAQRMISLLAPEERKVAESLLHYGPDSVGRLMTPDFLDVKETWTVKRVLDYVRTHGRDSETLNHIYITDNQGRLADDIRIREILLAPLHTYIRDIMDRQFTCLSVTDDKRDAVEVFRKYDRSALPVVDARGVLVGIVTIDDVIDVAEEEATRDLQRFGGLEALDEPYRATPLLAMVRKRGTWLIVLFLGEMLTATAMGFFEDEIARAVVLALFVPLIISSGGNSGSQAATLLIRALAVREVGLRDWWWVMQREVMSGLLLGILLGVIGFSRVAASNAMFNNYGPHWALIGLTVGISLVGVVLLGTLAGSMLPFILKRLGLDPATSSAPFVATLVDVTGLFIYFTAAVVLLRGTLL